MYRLPEGAFLELLRPGTEVALTCGEVKNLFVSMAWLTCEVSLFDSFYLGFYIIFVMQIKSFKCKCATTPHMC